MQEGNATTSVVTPRAASLLDLQSAVPAVTPQVAFKNSIRPPHKAKAQSSHKNKSKLPPSFPEIVFTMVTATAESKPDVIDWVENGSAFRIKENHRHTPNVIRTYFNRKCKTCVDESDGRASIAFLTKAIIILDDNYRSLQRQLNIYGWKKHVSGM